MESREEGHRRDARTERARTNGDDLKKSIDWELTETIFTVLRLHGIVKWTTWPA